MNCYCAVVVFYLLGALTVFIGVGRYGSSGDSKRSKDTPTEKKSMCQFAMDHRDVEDWRPRQHDTFLKNSKEN